MTGPGARRGEQRMRILSRAGAELVPDRYVEPGFAPRLSFEVPGPGWVARQFVEGFFDVQLGPVTLDVIAVQLCRPTGFHATSTSERAVASAAAALVTLRSNPELRVGPAREESLAGLPAVTVDVDTTTPPESDPPVFSPVMCILAGPISLASARRLRISLIELPDGLLAILVGGSIAAWPQAEAAAAPILASLRLEPAGKPPAP